MNIETRESMKRLIRIMASPQNFIAISALNLRELNCTKEQALKALSQLETNGEIKRYHDRIELT